MEKKLVLTLAIALGVVSGAHSATDDYTGHTFLTVRPQGQSTDPIKSSLYWPGKHQMMYADSGWGISFQAAVFGGKSTNNKNLSKYFLFDGLNEVAVRGNNADAPTNLQGDQGIGRNIDPLYFNVYSNTLVEQTFSSDFSFRPKQSTVGGLFEFRAYCPWFMLDDNDMPRLWFDVSFPVVRVKNDMKISETVNAAQTAPAATSALNITQAFRGENGFSGTAASAWNYGKIDGSRQHTGVADLEIKIGSDYVINDSSYLCGYVGVIAPTGNRPKAEYVFEPIVGNNHHFGLMTGAHFGFEVMEFCNGGLFLEVETNGRYLFKNHQVRSFDLYNRPFSRYMPVYAAAPVNVGGDGATATNVTSLLPGINYFTQEVNVHPHFQHSMLTALSWERSGFEAELGYSFWARQTEGIELRNTDAFPAGLAIAGVNGFAAPATGQTSATVDGNINRASIIGANFNNAEVAYDTPGALITVADLNLQSAASPAALSHTVYGSVGYNWDMWCMPVFVAVGGSYEFSTNNVALNRWTAWGKFGITL